MTCSNDSPKVYFEIHCVRSGNKFRTFSNMLYSHVLCFDAHCQFNLTWDSVKKLKLKRRDDVLC